MQTIGLVGGLSWHSSAEYYRLINDDVHRRRGGHHSARVLLSSLDFAEIREMQQRAAWDEAGAALGSAAAGLEAAGSDLVLICSNLMHKVSDRVEAEISVPLLHIADAAAAEARSSGFTRLGLVGARWVMEEDFYRRRLARHGIGTVIPAEEDRAMIDRVIFDELTRGRIVEESRAAYAAAIRRLAERGADAILLGCTEIGLLVGGEDSPIPLIDTTTAHAAHAVHLATMAPAEPA